MAKGSDWNPSLWMDTFKELVDEELEYDDKWTFQFNYSQTEEVTRDEKRRGWKVYIHCACGNFRCEACSNTWSSARTTVLYRYRLRGNRGVVSMRPFGQACRRCQDDGFNLPGFSKEVVEKSFIRLFGKIKKKCYNEDSDGDEGPAAPFILTKPHESSLCEACRLGMCCQNEEESQSVQ
ncbi:receptor-transporting protein 4-like [Cheilinus undulatus]|uniref:receptor-transporting protein 4-like n=1 Tax=Cheilinus undulatus TaxID=241271 RepID=UPI001BD656BE|nr:receptor-transporting protein 4-like [Cheilinus undulatus]